MKRLPIIIAVVAIFTAGTFMTAYSEDANQYNMVQNNMGSMMDTCQSMMNSIPQDVIIRTVSSQVAKVDQESNITLLVLDKETGNPLDNVDVILHIEKGAPMESMEDMGMMDMMGRMVEAENIGDGKYLVRFTPAENGYYTMHTHAIPQGKSMMSMMNNHMDIGIIAK